MACPQIDYISPVKFDQNFSFIYFINVSPYSIIRKNTLLCNDYIAILIVTNIDPIIK